MLGFDILLLLICQFFQVACALLMAGKNLDDHIDVKNILIEMGIYFQVQVILQVIRYNRVLYFFSHVSSTIK